MVCKLAICRDIYSYIYVLKYRPCNFDRTAPPLCVHFGLDIDFRSGTSAWDDWQICKKIDLAKTCFSNRAETELHE